MVIFVLNRAVFAAGLSVRLPQGVRSDNNVMRQFCFQNKNKELEP